MPETSPEIARNLAVSGQGCGGDLLTALWFYWTLKRLKITLIKITSNYEISNYD